jgi:hypothetical protein
MKLTFTRVNVGWRQLVNDFSKIEARLFCVLRNKATMSRVYSSFGSLPLKLCGD